jgi:hypothetical protein
MKIVQQFMLGMILFVSFASCATPIKNAKTETFKVAGNCDMCKENIETAAAKKGIAKAEWNVDSKLLTLTYNSKKTTAAEVLKRIAYAGYDNEQFLAPDDAYAKLAQCCQYDRMKKEAVQTDPVAVDEHGNTTSEPATQEAQENLLKSVYANYFSLKDALIKDDGTTAAAKASALAQAIDKVDMTQFTSEQHTVWMKELKSLKTAADQLAATKDVAKQRGYFTTLSTSMYAVAKVYKADETLYYQHCLMYNDGEGANWLSKENTVRNPYFGNAMLTCGKTTETIK